MEERGYRVKFAPNVMDRHGYLAGKDGDRAAGVNAMMADQEVDAIICMGGGYGAIRLLPHLQLEPLQERPKIILGYSDITLLHLVIGQNADLVTFYGPNFCGLYKPDVTDYTLKAWEQAMTSPEPLGPIAPNPDDPWVWTITPGLAEGEIIGGCLSLVAATLGTPYEIDTRGKILVLEDLDEEPYQLDCLLSQLVLAGKLQEAVGLVIGECVRMEPVCRDEYYLSLSFENVLQELVAPLGIPAIYGLPIGHGKNKATLPLGVQARLDADRGELTILEAATC